MDHSWFWRLLWKSKPPNSLHRRGQDADLLALRAGDHADGAHQLVFGGQAAVEEGDDELLGAAGEDQAEEDLVDGAGALLGDGQCGRGGCCSAPAASRACGEYFTVSTMRACTPPWPVASNSRSMFDQVGARVHVAARDLGTEIGLDEDRLARVEARPAARRVSGESEWIFSAVASQRRRVVRGQQRDGWPTMAASASGADQHVRRACGALSGPLGQRRRPSSSDIEIEHGGGEGRRSRPGPQGDDARREIAELLRHGELFGHALRGAGEDERRPRSRKTGTAQKTAPRMKATVRLSVSSEASMPSASSAAPISQ